MISSVVAPSSSTSASPIALSSPSASASASALASASPVFGCLSKLTRRTPPSSSTFPKISSTPLFISRHMLSSPEQDISLPKFKSELCCNSFVTIKSSLVARSIPISCAVFVASSSISSFFLFNAIISAFNDSFSEATCRNFSWKSRLPLSSRFIVDSDSDNNLVWFSLILVVSTILFSKDCLCIVTCFSLLAVSVSVAFISLV